MNKHLEPVFNLLLPALDKAGIDYWVYGGVSVAAYEGRFIRDNDDVDIFVRDRDYEKVEPILKGIQSNNVSIGLKNCRTLDRDGYKRPKLEVWIDDNEIMSVVPTFLKYENLVLVFGNGAKNYSVEILEKNERNLSGFTFITPSNKYIKRIFLDCLPSRINSRSKERVQKDAKAILSTEEYQSYYPAEDSASN